MANRNRNERAELGEQMSAGNRDMNENVESERMVARPSESGRDDLNAGDEGIDESSRRPRNNSRINRNARSSFKGQGAQKEGDTRHAQGTGYTNDPSEQLQEDGDESGSQGRHGHSGSRQGGQTAQNPRGSEDVDRSVM